MSESVCYNDKNSKAAEERSLLSDNTATVCTLDSAVKRRISSFLAALLQKSDTLQSEVLVAMEI